MKEDIFDGLSKKEYIVYTFPVEYEDSIEEEDVSEATVT